MRHIIYKITNTVNNKCYIGQTKDFDSQSKKWGLEKRWKKHIYNAKTDRNKCVCFENAIRKYGHEKFKPEILIKCDTEDVNEFEILYIRVYESTEKKYGYNITKGGEGINGVEYTESYRTNMSKGHGSVTGVANIKPIKCRKTFELIGYKVCRMIDNKVYSKDFSQSDKTIEEKFKLANQWLEELKQGSHREKTYDRENKLPKNISYEKNKKKEIVGYRVRIGKKLYGTFSSSSLTMNKKLQLAIQCRDNALQ